MDDLSEGKGDSPPRLSRSDMAMRRRAIRERWGVPDEMKTDTLWVVHGILNDPAASERDRLAAAKLVIAANKSDQDEDRLAIEQAKLEASRDTGQADDDYTIDLSQEADQAHDFDAPSA